MGEMTITIDDGVLLRSLQEAASRSGQQPDALARDLITYQLNAGSRETEASRTSVDALSSQEQERRRRLVEELRDIRSMTLKPFELDSTSIIREMRDADD